MDFHDTQLTSTSRKLIFISHANPQDNAVALWLASRLSLAGYSVWSDITRLFGGDVFWDNIEDAIRRYSAKFIVLVSNNSRNAPGVLDEVNVAITVERKSQFPRFVIPIRLDDLPFDEFRANISRKIAIDFSTNWADGLKKIIEVLEKDNIPKQAIGNSIDISNWFSHNYQPPTNVLPTSQDLTSNWIPIIEMPEYLHFSLTPIPAAMLPQTIQTLSYPYFLHEQFIGSFASNSDLQPGMPRYLILSPGPRVKTDDFLSGKASNFPNVKSQDAQNMVAGLLRKSWENKVRASGLLSYRLSDYTSAWYLPQHFTDNDTVKYTDLNGRVRTKKLVGKSERFNLFWHFAVSARPSFGRLNRFALRTHVIFTSDGNTPLSSIQRMHSARRGFCRNWYNERWRGLLLAYLAYLSSDYEHILLKVGCDRNVVLDSAPYSFTSPVSLLDSVIPYQEKPDDDLEETAYDDVDLDDIEDLITPHSELNDQSDPEVEEHDADKP